MSEINTWPGWESVRLLGEGAFGKVYEIRREELGKVYKAALKVITIPQNSSEIEDAYAEGMDEASVTSYYRSFVEDIAEEFALMSDLKGNSNIVSYEDHEIRPHADGIGWDILIRMELLTPLQKWAVSHTLGEDEIVRLGEDICRALVLCEKKNIIHRDIKPENIFVNENGDFKIGDFGIARTIEKTASNLSKKGTYSYMAPEVYLGQPYGYPADIYSLATVLYRSLNENRTPFLPQGPIRYQDRDQALEKRMSGEEIPAPLHGSKQLQTVVLTALAFDPNKRYQTAEEFYQALHACRGGSSDDRIEDVKDWTEEEEATVGGLHGVPDLEEEKTTYGKKKVVKEEDGRKKKTREKSKGDAGKKPILIGGIAGAVLFILLIALIGGSGKKNTGGNNSSVSNTTTTKRDEPTTNKPTEGTTENSTVSTTESTTYNAWTASATNAEIFMDSEVMLPGDKQWLLMSADGVEEYAADLIDETKITNVIGLHYESSDESVVKIGYSPDADTYYLQAVAEGEATITGSIGDASAQATIWVKRVNQSDGIELHANPSEITLPFFGTVSIDLTIDGKVENASLFAYWDPSLRVVLSGDTIENGVRLTISDRMSMDDGTITCLLMKDGEVVGSAKIQVKVE